MKLEGGKKKKQLTIKTITINGKVYEVINGFVFKFNKEFMEKKYFASVDDTICTELKYHLISAKAEGLKEIELIEAVLDTDNKDYIWCLYDGEVTEISDCCKTFCAHYESKSNDGICNRRGNLYTYGESVKFEVL